MGQAAHVTLAVVDEGILRLTHQKNPDPADWYFGKRALSMAYRDDYGRLLDPNLGAAAAVSFGGDEVGGSNLTAVPIRTVALWSGMVDTDGAGRATIRLPAAPISTASCAWWRWAWTDNRGGRRRQRHDRAPAGGGRAFPAPLPVARRQRPRRPWSWTMSTGRPAPMR